MMRIATCSVPGSGQVNEDLVVTGDRWAVVLDGAGQYPGVDVGCIHDVVWVVGRLGAHLAAELPEPAPLADVLSAAIAATAADHGPACDLTHPLAYGATVAMARERAGLVEWLVLGDAAAVVEQADGSVFATHDDRVDRLPNPPVTDAEVRTYDPEYVARWRNQPGGFWVASTLPSAAYEAYTGSLTSDDTRRVLLCTDGITRLVDRYDYEWRDLLALTETPRGVWALVDAVRSAERADPDPRRWRGKRHDDATAALIWIERGDASTARRTRKGAIRS